MNEKVAKKVGEAYAFSQILNNLYSDYPAVVEELLEDKSTDIENKTSGHISGLERVAQELEMHEVVVTKAEKTVSKITGMGETYVGDEWDNPVEVLEWMSFFLGAAIIHWNLILGSAQEMGHDDFASVAGDGLSYFQELFQALTDKSEEVGKARAQG